MTHTYNISGMTCGGCQAKVQALLSKVAGIKNISIDLQKGEAIIDMDPYMLIIVTLFFVFLVHVVLIFVWLTLPNQSNDSPSNSSQARPVISIGGSKKKVKHS